MYLVYMYICIHTCLHLKSETLYLPAVMCVVGLLHRQWAWYAKAVRLQSLRSCVICVCVSPRLLFVMYQFLLSVEGAGAWR